MNDVTECVHWDSDKTTFVDTIRQIAYYHNRYRTDIFHG